MTCLLCQSPCTEIAREDIPAAQYPAEYDIETVAKVQVHYECQGCKLQFWVMVKPEASQ